jgi:hypothetical protein
MVIPLTPRANQASHPDELFSAEFSEADSKTSENNNILP